MCAIGGKNNRRAVVDDGGQVEGVLRRLQVVELRLDFVRARGERGHQRLRAPRGQPAAHGPLRAPVARERARGLSERIAEVSEIRSCSLIQRRWDPICGVEGM